MTTRSLIEAVQEPERYPSSELSDVLAVDAADYDALRAAVLAVLDDLLACRLERNPSTSGGWKISAGEDGGMALNKVLPNARALREKLR